MTRKWFSIGVLVAAELLSMGVWFSASAVGALLLAIFNLADRARPDRLLAVSALAAALFTAMIPALAEGLASALCLRFATGFCLAGGVSGGDEDRGYLDEDGPGVGDRAAGGRADDLIAVGCRA